jgi:hypothetical protein
VGGVINTDSGRNAAATLRLEGQSYYPSLFLNTLSSVSGSMSFSGGLK